MRTAARISKPCLHSSHSYADAHVTAVLSRALASLCSYLYLLLYKTVVCFQNIKPCLEQNHIHVELLHIYPTVFIRLTALGVY